LKLRGDALLSNVAFNFSVRRYTPVLTALPSNAAAAAVSAMSTDKTRELLVGAYTRPLFGST
jgi:hypothetical protein